MSDQKLNLRKAVMVRKTGGNPNAFNMGGDSRRNHLPQGMETSPKQRDTMRKKGYDPVKYTSPIKETVEKCDCGAPFRPGVVMDPFAGSGTVGMVAKENHRSSISIEINPRYCDMVKERVGFNNRTIDDAVKFIYTKVR